MEKLALSDIPLFQGLEPATLLDIGRQMRRRRFQRGELICKEGERGDSLFVIQSGTAHVTLDTSGGAETVARLRRGDVVGEMSLLTGEPRSANVLASSAAEVLELQREVFASLLARHPPALWNLTRILSRRLARTSRQLRSRRQAEVVALVAEPHRAATVASAIGATRAASAGEVAALDLSGALAKGDEAIAVRTVKGLLNALDSLVTTHSTILCVLSARQEGLPLLLEQVDRVVVLGSEAEARALATGGAVSRSAEVVLVTDGPGQPPARLAGLRFVRSVDADQPADIAWLGRHLSRTKLGLALGSGGAKGYAHVAVLQALQGAGYTVDYLAGSSIGAVVGAWFALGQDAAAIEATMRRVFTPETVETLFRPMMLGASTALEDMARVWRETTGDRSFSDLVTPLVVMAVDLSARLPAPITEGPLWAALMAATAVPGLVPPYERGNQRLIDATALVPVPTRSLIDAGADITIAVNLTSRESLACWPGGGAPAGARSAERGPRAVETLLDVMDLAQLDSSARQAAQADLVIAPRFGPSHWRDFGLADQFLAAGREAAEGQIDALTALARPQFAPRHGPRPPGGGAAGKSVPGGAAPESGKPRRTFTFDDLKEILTRLIRLPETRLPAEPNASFEALGLDSIDFIEIQIEIEQRYGIYISARDAGQISTVADALAYVNRRLQETR